VAPERGHGGPQDAEVGRGPAVVGDEVDRLGVALDERNREADRLARALDERNRELEQARSEQDRLRHDLEAIRSSRIWRWSSPVRALGRWLGR
jgi:hypothetical protein